MRDHELALQLTLLDKPDPGDPACCDRVLHEAHITRLAIGMPQPSLCGPERPPCREKASSDRSTAT
jgi:hypothetical protein